MAITLEFLLLGKQPEIFFLSPYESAQLSSLPKFVFSRYPEGHPNAITPVGDRELTESEKTRVILQRNTSESGEVTTEVSLVTFSSMVAEV